MSSIDHPMSRAADVSFRQVKLFDAVGRLGAMTTASRALGLSQPAATQALAVFQRKCGFRLFNPGAKGTGLTPRGRELHARLARVLARLDDSLLAFGAISADEIVWRLSQTQVHVLEAMRENRSLDLAAIALGISLRSAQRAIAGLEALIGRSLVERDDGVFVLTDTGALLARRIGLLARELEWAIADLRETDGRLARTLVIGVAPDPGTASLNAVVKAHIASRAASCIEIHEAGQAELLSRLAIGAVDLVVGHIVSDARDDVMWQVVGTSHYRIVARAGHPLAGVVAVSAEQLAQHAWILGVAGSERREATDALFSNLPPPPCALITSAAPMIGQMIAASDMLGMMTDLEIARRPEALVAIAGPIAETPVLIGVALRIDWRPSAEQSALLDRVVAHLVAT